MRRHYKLIIVVLIMFLSIGFAYLTANLDITGTIAFRENTWDVHLDNIVVDSECADAPTPTINNDKDTVNLTVSLTRPGDYYEFYLDVVNNGTMDATLDSTTKTTLTGDYLSNLNYNVSYYSDRTISQGDLLRAGQKERIKVRVEYKYDLNSYTELSDLNLYFKVNYKKTDTHSSTYNSKVWNFDSKGEEDVFTVPKTGTYKLEVWGAQGGYGRNTTYYGGYGGYSVGTISLTANNTIYINVGGKGTDSEYYTFLDIVKGGYNGGGYSIPEGDKYSGSGGGATHIATKSGLLKSLSGYLSNLVIVAGGGGPGCYESNNHYSYGGSAGGYLGNESFNYNNTGLTIINGGGGSQSSGGSGYPTANAAAGFGQGANAAPNCMGGGGGYYGGGTGRFCSGGGGGSGYIGNTNLTNKIMYCYNCQSSENEADEIHIKTRSTTNVSDTPTSNYAKSGHGYARITLVS